MGLKSMLTGIGHKAKRLLPLLAIWRHNVSCRARLLKPLYIRRALKHDEVRVEINGRTVISMVLPETTFCGGFSDRFRAIVSVYAECRRRNIPFRVYFDSYPLDKILTPNEYDWRIGRDEISFDLRHSYPCTLQTYDKNLLSRHQRSAQRFFLRRYLQKDAGQIHIYSNMALEEESFGRLFKELFKPSPALAGEIDRHLVALMGKGQYISLVFRFTSLLGDFQENGDLLSPEEQENMIVRCLEGVKQFKALHPAKRVLVTSDSGRFLSRVSSLEGIYVVPGSIVHMGFTNDASLEVYMRSFLDFYLLAYSSSVYQAKGEHLFDSGFPRRAAMLENIDYEDFLI